MGYMKEKYTKAYYLKKDEYGNDTSYGVEGLKEFENGDIRSTDKDILKRIDFTGKNVLDIGFGRGEALKFASDNGATNLVGVDFSESAYEIATNFLDEHGIVAKLYCEEATAFLQSYLLNPNRLSFDIVIMLDCVEHIPRNELTIIMRVLSRCLSRKSIIAVNTPIFKVDNDVISEGLNPKARDTSDEFLEVSGMHCNRYTKKSFKDYMRSFNFKSISGHLFAPNLQIVRFLEGKKEAWVRAYNNGYPIFLEAMNYPERFEYAMTSEESRNQGTLNLLVTTSNFIKNKLRPAKDLIKEMLFNSKPPTVDKNQDLLIPNPSWKTIEYGCLKGHEMLLDFNSSAYWHKAIVKGKYDEFIYNALKDYNLTSKIIWDVGSHIGFHTLSFASLTGKNGKVFAFEPNPINFNRLQENMNRNPNLVDQTVLLTYALSNVDGQSEFIFSGEIENGSSSGSHLHNASVPEELFAYEGFQKQLVKTFKADTLISMNEVGIPSVIKIDVEGAEKLVLEGSLNLLLEYKPILLIEVHNITMMFYVQKILCELGYNSEILDSDNSSLSRCFIIAKHMRSDLEMERIKYI
jgi:FkbM family methyltransferase